MIKILLPVDGSENALNAVRYLAKLAKHQGPFEIHLLNIQHLPAGLLSAGGESPAGNDSPSIREGKKALESAEAILRLANIPFQSHIEMGVAFDSIARYAHAQSCDGIVMGTRGMGRVAQLIIGSVALKVVHRVWLPVTLVGPRYAEPTATQAAENWKVLLPVDGSDSAKRAVEYFLRLTPDLKRVEIELLNIQPEIVNWQTHGLGQQAGVAHLKYLADNAAAEAKKLLDAAGAKFTFNVKFGEPAEVIAQLTHERRFDNIVMGSRGLGTVENTLLGSVAYKVVHLTDVPVTLVK